jgi:hypothetical protein
VLDDVGIDRAARHGPQPFRPACQIDLWAFIGRHLRDDFVDLGQDRYGRLGQRFVARVYAGGGFSKRTSIKS